MEANPPTAHALQSRQGISELGVAGQCMHTYLLVSSAAVAAAATVAATSAVAATTVAVSAADAATSAVAATTAAVAATAAAATAVAALLLLLWRQQCPLATLWPICNSRSGSATPCSLN